MNQMITRKHAIMSNLRTRFAALRSNLKKLSKDNRGEGFLDMAMKILIVVIIGAAVLGVMNAAMPDLFQDLINRVSDQLNGMGNPN